MDLESTYDDLLSEIYQRGRHATAHRIAFSGGVDSSLVAHLVHQVFPSTTRALLGISASLPAEQRLLAHHIARHLTLPLEEILTKEGELPEYQANEGQSCFYCKTTLYQTMVDLVEHLDQLLSSPQAQPDADPNASPSTPTAAVLYNGTNADDLEDPTRLGIRAAAEYQVQSPLRRLTKAKVRELAQKVGLPNWNFAASPCLRSRLQYGVPATTDHLARIERAEQWVRRSMRLEPTANLRVRHLRGDAAVIEADEDYLELIQTRLEELTSELLAMGYSDVSVRPFRSGNLSLYSGNSTLTV